MVRRIVGARFSAYAAWLYALLVFFIMAGRGPARAQIPTVFGEISHLDELKLTKRESIKFLKRGGIIDGPDLEEIFQAIPHLSGTPRRPRRQL